MRVAALVLQFDLGFFRIIVMLLACLAEIVVKRVAPPARGFAASRLSTLPLVAA
jgi:hypothetical protein